MLRQSEPLKPSGWDVLDVRRSGSDEMPDHRFFGIPVVWKIAARANRPS
jgi:hypothetical protein